MPRIPVAARNQLDLYLGFMVLGAQSPKLTWPKLVEFCQWQQTGVKYGSGPVAAELVGQGPPALESPRPGAIAAIPVAAAAHTKDATPIAVPADAIFAASGAKTPVIPAPTVKQPEPTPEAGGTPGISNPPVQGD